MKMPGFKQQGQTKDIKATKLVLRSKP